MMTCCLLLSELTDYLFCINNNDTRYYYLSLKRVNKNTSWSIHGLWPQYSQTSYPQFCKNIPFDIEKIKPMLLDLNKFWYSGIEPNNVFWKHEWEKHGTCMIGDLSVLEYFTRALNVFHNAREHNWFDCCNLSRTECLIPFDLDYKFMGCH